MLLVSARKLEIIELLCKFLSQKSQARRRFLNFGDQGRTGGRSCRFQGDGKPKSRRGIPDRCLEIGQIGTALFVPEFGSFMLKDAIENHGSIMLPGKRNEPIQFLFGGSGIDRLL